MVTASFATLGDPKTGGWDGYADRLHGCVLDAFDTGALAPVRPLTMVRLPGVNLQGDARSIVFVTDPGEVLPHLVALQSKVAELTRGRSYEIITRLSVIQGVRSVVHVSVANVHGCLPFRDSSKGTARAWRLVDLRELN